MALSRRAKPTSPRDDMLAPHRRPPPFAFAMVARIILAPPAPRPGFSPYQVYQVSYALSEARRLRAISARARSRSRPRAASRPSLPSSSALAPIMKTTRHTCIHRERRSGSSLATGDQLRISAARWSGMFSRRSIFSPDARARHWALERPALGWLKYGKGTISPVTGSTTPALRCRLSGEPTMTRVCGGPAMQRQARLARAREGEPWGSNYRPDQHDIQRQGPVPAPVLREGQEGKTKCIGHRNAPSSSGRSTR
jgi:hypothetical protein